MMMMVRRGGDARTTKLFKWQRLQVLLPAPRIHVKTAKAAMNLKLNPPPPPPRREDIHIYIYIFFVHLLDHSESPAQQMAIYRKQKHHYQSEALA